MASSKTKAGEKVFTFKKRVPVPVDSFEDDDDDFKPTKYRPPVIPATKVAGTSKGKSSSSKVKKGVAVEKSSVAKEFFSSESDSNGFISVPAVETQDKQNSALEELKIEDDEEILFEGEEENCDDVEFLCKMESTSDSFPSTSSVISDGKDAWRNLMCKMQQNQDSLQKVSKKGKVFTKKVVVQKSKAAVTFSQKKWTPTQSPIKKNARLEDNFTSKASIGSTNADIVPNVNPRFPSLTNDKVVDCSSDTNGFEVASNSRHTQESTTKVAPIFLPPAERKALQRTAVMKSDSNEILESIMESVSQFQNNNNLPEDPTQFDGNKVILNHYQPDTDPYGGNKTKVCPFYKKLPGTSFCVDAFNYGLIPGMEVYFLSHFHSDHYIGLSKKFCKTVICSYPTGNLVRMKLYVEEKCIRKLHMNKPYVVYDSEVTLVDANHCPGSVMFIFRFKNGTVTLHTGDFRYTTDMLKSPYLSGLLVDNLYLDTTYCSPQYDFPTQNESIANVISHVKKHIQYRPDTLILCGSYLIGKERVYFTLAEAIGTKVFGTYDKRKIINALENAKFSSLLSADENTARLHVVPMFSITAKNLQDYLAKYPRYNNIIGIKPSGWQFASCGSGCSVKSHYNGSVTLLGVPYSEHSSFSELKEFVTNLKPRKVQPTVNVGNATKRGEMMQHIETWLSK